MPLSYFQELEDIGEGILKARNAAFRAAEAAPNPEAKRAAKEILAALLEIADDYRPHHSSGLMCAAVEAAESKEDG